MTASPDSSRRLDWGHEAAIVSLPAWTMTTSRRAVAAAVLANLAGVLPLFLTGAMAVQLGRDFSIDPASIAVLASLFAATTMAGSAPLGRQVRRLGVRQSVRVASVGAAFATVACAASGSLIMLAAALMVAGIANALGQPAGNALVAAHVRSERLGIGFAIKQSAIPLATTLGGLAVPLIALTVGWQVAFLLAALVAAAAFALVPPDRTTGQIRKEGAVPRTLVRPLWLLAVGIMLAVLAATSIGALGAAGGVQVGLSEGVAGLVVAAGGAAGLAIRLFSGIAADRLSFDSLAVVALLCVLGAVGWLAMAFGTAPLFVVGLIVANAFGWGWPGLQHLSMARRFPAATAAASGVSQTGVAAGLMVGPLLLGLLATNVGWSATWLAAMVAALLAGLVILLASRRIPQP